MPCGGPTGRHPPGTALATSLPSRSGPRGGDVSASTILLVDDDEVLGQVLQRVLARQGCVVVQAGSVAQALQLAREHRPRLGLLDLCLPDGDGVELARSLAAEVGPFPRILMTAYPLRLRDHPELAHDFIRVLTKPLNLEELRHAVEQALAGAAPAPAPAAASHVPARPVPPPPAPAPAPPPEPPPAPRRRGLRLVPALVGLGVAAAALALVLPALGMPGLPDVLGLLKNKPDSTQEEGASTVRLVAGQPDTFDVHPETVKRLKIPPPVEVGAQALPYPLELAGSLAFDPDLLGRVQSRFPGEVITVGPDEHVRATSPGRPRVVPKYGDVVRAGQVLA